MGSSLRDDDDDRRLQRLGDRRLQRLGDRRLQRLGDRRLQRLDVQTQLARRLNTVVCPTTNYQHLGCLSFGAKLTEPCLIVFTTL